MTDLQALRARVNHLLWTSGKIACDLIRTRTTQRCRYRPGQDGYRIYEGMRYHETSFSLYLDVMSRRITTLREYAEILRKGGVETELGPLRGEKSKRVLWVRPSFDRYGAKV